MGDTKKGDEKEIEEERLAIEGYRDSETSESEVNGQYTNYLKARYEQIKGDYITLSCNQREADGSKNDEMKNRLNGLFTANYRARKWVVRELRAAGEKIDDRFIPG